MQLPMLNSNPDYRVNPDPIRIATGPIVGTRTPDAATKYQPNRKDFDGDMIF